jgi:hypothetical protein
MRQREQSGLQRCRPPQRINGLALAGDYAVIVDAFEFGKRGCLWLYIGSGWFAVVGETLGARRHEGSQSQISDLTDARAHANAKGRGFTFPTRRPLPKFSVSCAFALRFFCMVNPQQLNHGVCEDKTTIRCALSGMPQPRERHERYRRIHSLTQCPCERVY